MVERGSLTSRDWDFWHGWMTAQRLLNREFDRSLRQALAISKAEFSVLVTLHTAVDGRLRVGEIAESLDWDKGRVAHQLSRMEARDLVARVETGAHGRRTSVELTATGQDTAARAIALHANNIKALVLDHLTPEQRTAIGTWSTELTAELHRRDVT